MTIGKKQCNKTSVGGEIEASRLAALLAAAAAARAVCMAVDSVDSDASPTTTGVALVDDVVVVASVEFTVPILHTHRSINQ